MDVGQRLRRRRERFSLTQEWVADAMGIPRELLSYWETGARTPSPAHLRTLARLYRTTPHDLKSGSGPPDAFAPRDGLEQEDSHIASVLDEWEVTLDRWAEFLRIDLQRRPGGPDRPPPGLGERALVYDRRRASSLADRAREHWGLGRSALPELFSFADQAGILVYRRNLGSFAEGSGVTGVFFNHAELGFCAIVNDRMTPARQAFTLAHGVAHTLFHYSRVGVVCRTSASEKLERFSDAFAEHFLVPGKELRRRVEELEGAGANGSATPFDALRLAHVFRVSFPTMVMRLASERLIDAVTAAQWREIDGDGLARRLGLEPPGGDLGRTGDGPLHPFPASVLATVRGALRDGVVDVPRVAEVLGVSTQAVNDHLIAQPPTASGAAQREHQEFARLLDATA